MKLLKKIMIFVIIALIIQGAILFYLERFRFYEKDTVYVPKSIIETSKNVIIKVGTNSKDFKISQDGKFISFVNSNEFNVLEMASGKILKVNIEKGATISFYKWLEDSNKILYAEKIPDIIEGSSNKGVKIKFFYYNADDNSTEELRGKNLNNSIYIQDNNSNSEVTDMVVALVPNVMYIKLTELNQESTVYKLENMSDVKKITLNNFGVGNIGVDQKNGDLYYEDLNTKKIRNSTGKVVNITDVVKPIILGVDKNDNIYFGDVQSGKISKIYWGILEGNTNSFSSKDLKQPTEAKNIFIAEEGKIYSNDNLRGVVTEINSGTETEYKGILKCMYGKGIIAIQDEKVLKFPFK